MCTIDIRVYICSRAQIPGSVHIRFGLLVLFVPSFLNFLFMSNFQTTEFSSQCSQEHIKLKLGTHMDFGSWMTTYLGKSCSFCLPRVPFVNCRQFMYLVISLLVLRAGYGIWLYQFLIIAYLFTLGCQPESDCWCLVVPLFFMFFSLSNCHFRHPCQERSAAYKVENWYAHGQLSCIPISSCRCSFIPLYFHFSVSPSFKR